MSCLVLSFKESIALVLALLLSLGDAGAYMYCMPAGSRGGETPDPPSPAPALPQLLTSCPRAAHGVITSGRHLLPTSCAGGITSGRHFLPMSCARSSAAADRLLEAASPFCAGGGAAAAGLAGMGRRPPPPPPHSRAPGQPRAAIPTPATRHRRRSGCCSLLAQLRRGYNQRASLPAHELRTGL